MRLDLHNHRHTALVSDWLEAGNLTRYYWHGNNLNHTQLADRPLSSYQRVCSVKICWIRYFDRILSKSLKSALVTLMVWSYWQCNAYMRSLMLEYYAWNGDQLPRTHQLDSNKNVTTNQLDRPELGQLLKNINVWDN